MSHWFYRAEGRTQGPVSSATLLQLAAEGKVRPEDPVRKGPDGKWVRASAVKGLFSAQPETRSSEAQESRLESESQHSTEKAGPLASPRTGTKESPRRRLTVRDVIGIASIVISVLVVIGAVSFLIARRSGDTAVSQGPTATTSPENSHVDVDASPDDPEQVKAKQVPNGDDETEDEQASGRQTEDAPLRNASSAIDPPIEGTFPADLGPEREDVAKSPLPAADASTDGARPVQPAPLGRDITANPIVSEPAEPQPARAGPQPVQPSGPNTIPGDGETLPGQSTSTSRASFSPANQPVAPPSTETLREAPTGEDRFFGPVVSETAPPTQPEEPERPDPRVEQHTKKLMALYDQRKSLLEGLRLAEKNLGTIQQQIATTNTTLNQANVSLANAQGQLLEIAAQLLAFERSGGGNSREAMQLRAQGRILEQQQIPAFKAAIPKCNMDLMGFARQQKAAMTEVEKNRRARDEFDTHWMEHIDPYGWLSSAEHRATCDLCSQWLMEDREFPSAYLMRAYARMHLGELESSQEDFTQIIGQSDGVQLTKNQQAIVVSAALGRAMNCTKMGDDDRAKAELATVLRKNPRSAQAYMARGWNHATFGRGRSAVDDLVRATNLDGDNAVAFCEAARLLAVTPTIRDGARAVKFGRTACELTHWNRWQCLATYATANAAAGNPEEAVKWGTKSLELAPRDARAELESNLKLYRAGVVPES